MDCGTALLPAKPRRVTKPKIFENALHLRLPSGTKDRIDALRGERRQGDFVRELLLEAVDRAEVQNDAGRIEIAPASAWIDRVNAWRMAQRPVPSLTSAVLMLVEIGLDAQSKRGRR